LDKLNEIEYRYMSWEYDYNLKKEDIDWLIQMVKEQQVILNSIREVYPELFLRK
jgi:hypothetical protein